MKTSSFVLATACCICAMPSLDARAESPSNELKKLAAQATQAYADGEYQRAVDKLLAAYRIEPESRLLYNTARSYEELGDCRLALVYYRSFTQQNDAEASLVTKAQAALDASDKCAEYSATLAGRLVIDSQPPAASVTIDGSSAGTTPAEVAGLTSGAHRIEVDLEGYRPANNTLKLEAGQDRSVHAKLPKTKPVANSSAGRSVSDATLDGRPPAASSDTDINIPAVALAGAGVVGLGVGAYVDLVAIPNTDDQRDQYTPDQQRYADLTDQRASQANGALVGYIGGGALLAAGATWFIIDQIQSPSADASAARPVAAATKDGFFAGVAGHF